MSSGLRRFLCVCLFAAPSGTSWLTTRALFPGRFSTSTDVLTFLAHFFCCLQPVGVETNPARRLLEPFIRMCAVSTVSHHTVTLRNTGGQRHSLFSQTTPGFGCFVFCFFFSSALEKHHREKKNVPERNNIRFEKPSEESILARS